MIIQTSGKSAYLAKKVSFIKKLPIIKVKNFLKSKIDLHKTWGKMLPKNIKIGNLTQLSFLIFLSKIG